MLFLLSPAKALDYETPVPPELPHSAPQFARDAAALIEVMRKKSPQQVAQLMSLSDSLSALNVGRYQAWSSRATAKNSKQAVLAFNGDVYRGLDAKSLSNADLEWAQEHICILSGLYGVLRPLDRLQPYRLEMGTKLATERGTNLYEFWGTKISEHLNKRLARDRQPVVVNLASTEYAKVVDRKALKPRMIDCVFQESQGREHKVIGLFAKRARGLMARWAVQGRVAEPDALKGFDLERYAFAAGASSPDQLVFRRRAG